jgi:uncharacterized NAD(P)/FAD-binding protein YdhS
LDTHLTARVARASLGMANRRDGGIIVIGVSEDTAKNLVPEGLTPLHVETWKYDTLSAKVAPFADPYLELELEHVELDLRVYAVITVAEFEEVPVLCARDWTTPAGAVILRRGALYVRTRRQPETTEVASQTEMREVLTLAIEKGVRRFVATAREAGLTLAGDATDAAHFADELREFLGE